MEAQKRPISDQGARCRPRAVSDASGRCGPGPAKAKVQVGCRLNSLKRVIEGIIKGSIIGVIKGDTRDVDVGTKNLRGLNCVYFTKCHRPEGIRYLGSFRHPRPIIS